MRQPMPTRQLREAAPFAPLRDRRSGTGFDRSAIHRLNAKIWHARLASSSEGAAWLRKPPGRLVRRSLAVGDARFAPPPPGRHCCAMPRWGIWGILGAVVLVAAAAGVWGWMSAVPAETSVARPSESDLGVPGEVAEALELLETDPAALLPPELDELYGPDIAAAIPVGTTVEADPSSWVPSTAGGGTIHVELTAADGTVSTVVAVMGRYDGGWKVLQTIEVVAP